MPLVESTEQHPPTEGLRAMIPTEPDHQWLSSGGPGEVLASVIKGLPQGGGLREASQWASASDATKQLRVWANGRGAAHKWAAAEQSASAMTRQTHSRTQIRNARRGAADLRPSALAEWDRARAALETLPRSNPPASSPTPAPLGAW